ncbi:hypothetical protein, partial [Streptomyces sp. NPDC048643]|uniref:hypothetical protein n=1 Tax=Streptomyces sp. NPDC048643 TaxID=3155637 RepID=UPI003436720D
MKQLASGPTRRGTNTPARPWLRRIAAAAGLALIPGLLTPVAFADDAEPLGAGHVKKPVPVKVTPFTAKINKKNAAIVKESAAADRAASRRARTDQRRTVTWPGAGSAT